MENNKKKITDYVQDLGALIALLLLVIGISIISLNSGQEATFYPCCASHQLMGLLHLA